jgi:hypothetical protein
VTTIPLGTSAYRRLYSGEPDVILLNRWLEKNPSNLREHTTLLARPGTTPLLTLDQGGWTAASPYRGSYALDGLFSDSLFVAVGESFYRINQDMSVTPVTGVLNGTGHPEVAWQKGIGYERLFITDGLNVQFYAGTTAASGTLVGEPATTQTIQLGSQYYAWVAAITGGEGSVGSPWQVLNSTGDTFNQLLLAITAGGTAGVDYSPNITGPNPQVTAISDGLSPIQTLTIQAVTAGAAGNSLVTVLTSGSGLTFSGATLANGGIDALQGVAFPDGASCSSLSQCSSFVLCSQTDTQQVFWIEPGATTIDPLNFISKESSPDPVVSLRAVGDNVLVLGEKSTENWYATGDANAAFAPIEGRVYMRGSEPGTAVIVGESVVLVGDDGRVYTVGYNYSDTDVSWGIQRISDNGIEERVRRQIRREAGLTP